MTRTTTTSVRAAGPARPGLLVLLLLVGLLGMHGLAGGHAGMAAAAVMRIAAPTATPDTDMDGMRTAAEVPVATTVGEPAGPAAGHFGEAIAGLCLAVLTGALLLLAGTRRSLPAHARLTSRLPSWLLARARALPLPPPPDLVAGLCVSRT